MLPENVWTKITFLHYETEKTSFLIFSENKAFTPTFQNYPQQLDKEKNIKQAMEKEEKRCLYTKMTSFHTEKMLRNPSLKAVTDDKVDSARLQNGNKNTQSQLY